MPTRAATRCCFLGILATGFFESGVAFQPSNHQRALRSVQIGRNHVHRREGEQSTALFIGRAPTDPSIIASNREYLINVLGVSPNKVKTIEIRRAENNWGGEHHNFGNWSVGGMCGLAEELSQLEGERKQEIDSARSKDSLSKTKIYHSTET